MMVQSEPKRRMCDIKLHVSLSTFTSWVYSVGAW